MFSRDMIQRTHFIRMLLIPSSRNMLTASKNFLTLQSGILVTPLMLLKYKGVMLLDKLCHHRL